MGAGPAGLAAARAAADAGLRVRVVDPAPDEPWPNNYGAWIPEFEALGLADTLGRRWASARVHLDEARSLSLPRGYGQVDGAALRHRLAAGLPLQAGAVAALAHDATGVTATLADGQILRATLALDATGAQTSFIQRRRDLRPGFQAALGWEVELVDAPWPADEMRLMDFGDFPGATPAAPTFLYVMPLGGGRWFVEETVLVGRPARPFAELEGLLRARLAHAGATVGAIHAVERCLIPMGLGLPRADQPVLGLGAAAGMVHPATGYSLPHSLRAAPRLAQAVAQALGADGATPADAAATGWAAVWPRDRRRAWTILTYGMEVLCRLGAPATRDFFAAFFQAPDWADFLAGTQPVPALTRTMRQVFAAAPWGIRARLMGGTASGPGLRLFGALLG
ncbi:MAG: lycopene cyclase family protein [Myxococcales bacterium]|nr:lycopene cyclase family protein [Myxococcales bacterium]